MSQAPGRPIAPSQPLATGNWPAENNGVVSASKERTKEIVRLPIFHADAVDLKLVDAKQPPKLLIDAKVHAEARVPRENIPTIAMRMQGDARSFAQLAKAAEANRIDIDDPGVAAAFATISWLRAMISGSA